MTEAGGLELRDVRVEVPGRRLLDALTVTWAPGELIALVGKNGAGKTTLLRTALGLTAPAAGGVYLAGRPLAAHTPRARAGLVAWLPQQTEVSEPLPAWEVVAAARFRFGEAEGPRRQAALRHLEAVGAADLTDRAFSVMSGGERQRVAWAALLAQEAPMLLLDEPASHLDPPHQAEAYLRIGELWRQGRGVLCVTHDVNLLRFAGEPAKVRILGLDAGRIVLDTTYDDPALGAALGRVYGVELEAYTREGRRIFVPKGAS